MPLPGMRSMRRGMQIKLWRDMMQDTRRLHHLSHPHRHVEVHFEYSEPLDVWAVNFDHGCIQYVHLIYRAVLLIDTQQMQQ